MAVSSSSWHPLDVVTAMWRC